MLSCIAASYPAAGRRKSSSVCVTVSLSRPLLHMYSNQVDSRFSSFPPQAPVMKELPNVAAVFEICPSDRSGSW